MEAALSSRDLLAHVAGGLLGEEERTAGSLEIAWSATSWEI